MSRLWKYFCQVYSVLNIFVLFSVSASFDLCHNVSNSSSMRKSFTLPTIYHCFPCSNSLISFPLNIWHFYFLVSAAKTWPESEKARSEQEVFENGEVCWVKFRSLLKVVSQDPEVGEVCVQDVELENQWEMPVREKRRERKKAVRKWLSGKERTRRDLENTSVQTQNIFCMEFLQKRKSMNVPDVAKTSVGILT